LTVTTAKVQYAAVVSLGMFAYTFTLIPIPRTLMQFHEKIGTVTTAKVQSGAVVSLGMFV